MSKAARTAALAIALGFTAVATGCAVPAQQEATVTRESDVPFNLLDPEAQPLVPQPPGPGTGVALCFVRDGRLEIVEVELTSPAGLQRPLDALLSPPADAGPLLRSALRDPSVVRQVDLVGGIARVDLLPTVSALPAEEQVLAIAQIVCTLTGLPGVGQVSFTMEGTLLSVPKGDGSLVTSPLSRDDYANLLQG